MNLALRDIRHGLFRFVLTCFGLGLLMTVVLSMIGIYNGLVADALAVVKAPAADVWVVESGTKGPFAEASNIPLTTRDAVVRMPGVAEAGAISFQNIESAHAGASLRLYVIGHEPGHPGSPSRIVEGRGIGTQRDHRADPGPARCLPSTTQRSYGFLRTGDRRGLDAQNSTRRAATFGRSWDERGRAAAGVVAVRGRSAS